MENEKLPIKFFAPREVDELEPVHIKVLQFL